MKRNRIVFLSQFSEASIRGNLLLKKFRIREFISRLKGNRYMPYQDYAIWVYEFLNEFEKHPEYEFHFVGPHRGMKRDIQSFELNGVNYHFF